MADTANGLEILAGELKTKLDALKRFGLTIGE